MTTIADKAPRRTASRKASHKSHKRETAIASGSPRLMKAEPKPVAAPAPLDVQELVKEFTEVTARLIAKLDTETVSQQQVATIVRQSVFDALRTRKQHHAQIIEIDRLVLRETRNSKIRERVPAWLARAGLRRIEELDAETKDWFTVLNPDDDGDCVRVMHPAYVDASAGTLVQSGKVKLTKHDGHGKRDKCVPLMELTVGTQAVTDITEEE